MIGVLMMLNLFLPPLASICLTCFSAFSFHTEIMGTKQFAYEDIRTMGYSISLIANKSIETSFYLSAAWIGRDAKAIGIQLNGHHPMIIALEKNSNSSKLVKLPFIKLDIMKLELESIERREEGEKTETSRTGKKQQK